MFKKNPKTRSIVYEWDKAKESFTRPKIENWQKNENTLTLRGFDIWESILTFESNLLTFYL